MVNLGWMRQAQQRISYESELTEALVKIGINVIHKDGTRKTLIDILGELATEYKLYCNIRENSNINNIMDISIYKQEMDEKFDNIIELLVGNKTKHHNIITIFKMWE